MEQTIEFKIPEGYIFDKDNSTENVIRFKPKKITYEDICNKLFLNQHSWRLTDLGNLKYDDCTSYDYTHANIISTSGPQLEQLLALNRLMNVAKYLNGDWEPNFTDSTHKFYIYYTYVGLELNIDWSINWKRSVIYFKSRELALQAIEILGKEEIKKALGIFE